MQQPGGPEQLEGELRPVPVPLVSARRIADDAVALQRRRGRQGVGVSPLILAADDDEVGLPADDLFDRDRLQRAMQLGRDVAAAGQPDPVVDQRAAAVGAERRQRSQVQDARPGLDGDPLQAPIQTPGHAVKIGAVGLVAGQGERVSEGGGGPVHALAQGGHVDHLAGHGPHPQAVQPLGLRRTADDGQVDLGGQQRLDVDGTGRDHRGPAQRRGQAVHPRLGRRGVGGHHQPVGGAQHQHRGVVGVPEVRDPARGGRLGGHGGQRQDKEKPRPDQSTAPGT